MSVAMVGIFGLSAAKYLSARTRLVPSWVPRPSRAVASAPRVAASFSGLTVRSSGSRLSKTVSSSIATLVRSWPMVSPSAMLWADGLVGMIRSTKRSPNSVLGRIRADKYFAAINPKMPTIAADISRLADVATTYAEATPDILRMLKALTTTSNTIVAKQDALAGFLAGTAGFANTAATFLNTNGDRIIQVGSVQRPTLALAARYAPEYPCFAQGLASWVPRATQMFSDHYFHITLEVVKPRAAYQPGGPSWLVPVRSRGTPVRS